MRGLTIVVATADADRFHAALSLAAAMAALGPRARIFLQGEAVSLLSKCASPADAQRLDQGIPTASQLLEESFALGVEIIACQSGLALCGISAFTLPANVSIGGLVGIMSGLGDDRLVIA